MSETHENKMINRKMAEINITSPREAVFKFITGKTGPCPRCRGRLMRQYQNYMAAIYKGTREIDTFLVGGNFGWFCPSCPTVVIDNKALQKLLSDIHHSLDINSRIVVKGIVNIDAIPETKRHVPIGARGNPAPLVEFSNLPAIAGSVRKK